VELAVTSTGSRGQARAALETLTGRFRRSSGQYAGVLIEGRFRGVSSACRRCIARRIGGCNSGVVECKNLHAPVRRWSSKVQLSANPVAICAVLKLCCWGKH
jgi:hypothetical protein